MERVYLFSDGLGQSELGWDRGFTFSLTGSARGSWGGTVMERVYLFSDGLGQSELGWDGDGEGLPFL